MPCCWFAGLSKVARFSELIDQGSSGMVQNRVCILTLGVGSGHLRASEVVQRALYDGNDPIEVKLIDALDLARPWFSWLYVAPYWWMLRHAPWLWRNLFERRQRKLHRATAPDWLFRRGCREVLRQIKNQAPHLVIVTEIGAAEIAALGRREGWFHAPILAVQTDFHTEPPWMQSAIDVYCVASEEARGQLIGWGVLPNRVFLCGIPVDPAFSFHFDRPDLLRALGLDSHRPVVLVMGGGMGPVPLDKIIESLQLCGVPLQALVVAGRDRELRRRLDLLRGRIAMDLHLFGWTDNIPELMSVSDLLITKPGGLTAAEALAAGLPMILTHPIPGPEERHVRFLEGKGVALHAEQLQDIPRLASRLLGAPEELGEMARRAREWSRPDAAYAIAQVGMALLDRATYIDLLAAPAQRSGESAYLM
jgi:processive 1,2-diacylglycerol beta-glucosyltransferase